MPPFFSSSFFSSSAAGLAGSDFFSGFLVLWPVSSFLLSGGLVCGNSGAEAIRRVSARAPMRRRYEFKEISYSPQRPWIIDFQLPMEGLLGVKQLAIGNRKLQILRLCRQRFVLLRNRYVYRIPPPDRRAETSALRLRSGRHRIESLAYAEEIPRPWTRYPLCPL